MADETPQLITIPEDGTVAKLDTTKLKEMIDSANLQYTLKNYTQAADLYSSATEIQAELNGEMAPENAELLYLYGRCLYKVAVANSDVLGGQVAAEKKKSKANGTSKQNGAAAAGSGSAGDTVVSKEQELAEQVVEAAVEEKDALKSVGQQERTPASQPYFQITGMENWDSDEEDEDAEDDPEEQDEEDDFATAFEILDVARVLLERQIDALNNDESNGIGKGKAAADEKSPLKHVKERLADTHDLQAEIALENERFTDAIPDFRASLALKQEIYPKESEIMAEAHFKLSLALEFASVDKVREAQAQEGQQTVMVKKEDIDEELRKEAAKEMEAAIESCRLRITKEEEALKGLSSEAAKAKVKSIADVKEMVEDMVQRVSGLPKATTCNH